MKNVIVHDDEYASAGYNDGVVNGLQCMDSAYAGVWIYDPGITVDAPGLPNVFL